ncbi:MAG: DUF4369 domain-containing protein [Bacteroidales bacterium]|nr:DUF4369 domain-containing protein [Bacteroidales bacterium]
MKKLVFFVLLALLAAGCKNHNLVINGVYPFDGHDILYLKKVDLKNPIAVDSATINNSGKFRFKTTIDEPSFYTLGFDNNEFITIVAEPGDQINIEFKAKRLQNEYSVEGSVESEKIRKLDKKLGRTLLKLDSLSREYNKIAGNDEEQEKATSLEKAYLDVLNEQRNFNIAFILDNLSKLSAIKALYQSIDENTFVLYKPRDLQYLKLVSDSLSKYYPGISLTKSLISNLEEELNQMYADRITQAAEIADPVKLDANLKNIQGQRIRLSDVMENNYVLLTFWSAESRECISNNLFLKNVYSLYHNDGLEIYQVNLDADEDTWRKSVNFDELPWISVREDDPSSPITARIFNVTGVPANYLFDKEGNIIGKDMFGKSLKIKLSQIFD